MFALDRASMGAIVVFRNVAPLITLAVERMLQERVELDAQTAASLVYVLGGVWLYVSHDVSSACRANASRADGAATFENATPPTNAPSK